MKLSHCVSHSVAKYEEVAPILRDSTKQLQTMKCDVQSLYRRIRYVHTYSENAAIGSTKFWPIIHFDIRINQSAVYSTTV